MQNVEQSIWDNLIALILKDYTTKINQEVWDELRFVLWKNVRAQLDEELNNVLLKNFINL